MTEKAAFTQIVQNEANPTIHEILKNKNPFIIRGHRLDLPYFNDEMLSDKSLERIRDHFLKMATDMRYEIENGDPFNTEYNTDVLGSNPTDKRISEYVDSNVAFMSEFLNLDDLAPVQLVRDPDKVCTFCTIGDHCKNRNNMRNPDQPDSSGDAYAMKNFLIIALWLGAEVDKDFTGVVNDRDEIVSITATKKLVMDVVTNRIAFDDWTWSLLST